MGYLETLKRGTWKHCSQKGAVAQLGERLVCNQEATGSIPVSSTNFARVAGSELRAESKTNSMLGVSELLASNIGLEELQKSCKGLNEYFLKLVRPIVAEAAK